MPNLVIVDGGMGQYQIAKNVLDSLRINTCLIALTKDKNHKTSYLIF